MAVPEDGIYGETHQRRGSRLRVVAPESSATGLGKRLCDLFLGSFLALLAVPVIVVCGAAMAVSLRAAPFFIHERVGRNGESFRVVKIRTLSNRTPRYADKYELGADATTPLSRVLRRLHLDELPQLLLVPIGRMSLVGPRPEMAHLYRRMPERQGGTRLRVRPGCTGLWQISTAYNRLIADAPEYDIFYVEHHSWRLDAWILWRTALIMLGIGSPVDLRDIPHRLVRAAPDSQETPVELERRRTPRADQPAWLRRIDETTIRTRRDGDGADCPEAAS